MECHSAGKHKAEAQPRPQAHPTCRVTTCCCCFPSRAWVCTGSKSWTTRQVRQTQRQPQILCPSHHQPLPSQFSTHIKVISKPYGASPFTATFLCQQSGTESKKFNSVLHSHRVQKGPHFLAESGQVLLGPGASACVLLGLTVNSVCEHPQICSSL